MPAFRGVRVCQQTQPGCWVNLTLQALRRGRQERAGAAEQAAGAHLARLLLGRVRGGRLGGGLWASLPLSPRPLCAGPHAGFLLLRGPPGQEGQKHLGGCMISDGLCPFQAWERCFVVSTQAPKA